MEILKKNPTTFFYFNAFTRAQKTYLISAFSEKLQANFFGLKFGNRNRKKQANFFVVKFGNRLKHTRRRCKEEKIVRCLIYA